MKTMSFARSIVEVRRAGHNARTSIITGLTKTGGIITAAGLIMAVAFVGLVGRVTSVWVLRAGLLLPLHVPCDAVAVLHRAHSQPIGVLLGLGSLD